MDPKDSSNPSSTLNPLGPKQTLGLQKPTALATPSNSSGAQPFRTPKKNIKRKSQRNYDVPLPTSAYLGTISLKGSQIGGSGSKALERERVIKKRNPLEITTTPLVQISKYFQSTFHLLFLSTKQ